MKKILTTMGLAGVVALTSHAQGFVFFSSSTQNMSTNNVGGLMPGVNATAGKTTGVANSFYYALFESSSPIALTAQQGNAGGLSGYAFMNGSVTLDTDPTAVPAANTATAGRFAATNPNADTSSTVPGIAGGATAYFIVVGWSANLGTSIAALEANLGSTQGMLGQSAASGALVLGNGGLTPTPNLFGGTAPTIQAFTLAPTTIPEPASMALVALGGASLLLFRRKK